MLRRAPTRSAAWGKEPTEKTRQTRTVRLPPKPLPSAWTRPQIYRTHRQDEIATFERPTEPRRATPEGSPIMLRTRTLLTKRSKTLMSMGIEERVGEVKVLIIGTTGGTGRILLEKALEQGHEVSALARNPSAVAPRDYRPRVLEGNTLDPDAVEAAVSGQDAVLSAWARAARSPRPLSRPVLQTG